MALFTGQGDEGETSLFGQKERASKTSLQTGALGALDEINTLIGVCRAKSINFKPTVKGKTVAGILEEVQQDLFVIQAFIGGAPKELPEDRLIVMEEVINNIEKELPPIKSFFLPGGTELSGMLDYARAVARRVERILVAYSSNRGLQADILRYLNRLSTLLYALVRFVNHKQDVEEIPPVY